MDRRTFISSATGGFFALPLVAEAQPTRKVSRIGVLGTSPPATAPAFQAFRKGLRELGYIEGQHVHLEYRWPEGERDAYPELATQLVESRVDLILTISAGAAHAAKQATDTTPIVFCSMGEDPIQLGLVASLARPGGNATGTVILSRELEAKRLELLKEAGARLARAAVLWNSSMSSHPQMLHDIEEAARRLNVRVIPVTWTGPADIEEAFQRARRARADGVLALAGPETWRAREQIARLAAEHRLPTIGSEPGFAAAGNLVQYGPDLPESCRHAAFHVVRILKGAKPSELPVEQPTRFSLVINLRTAKALGLTISPSLLGRADEVIQ
jgi:putative ABC transport system substrate-binding protein